MIPCYIGAIPVQLKAVLPGFTKGELGVFMPKGSEDLLEYVNEFLTEEKNKGRIDELADKYIYQNTGSDQEMEQQ